MKYCTVSYNPPKKEDIDFVGFHQWIDVFKGTMLLVPDCIDSLNDGDYHIVHILADKNDFTIIPHLRQHFGPHAKTKIIATVDTCLEDWDNEFDDIASFTNAISMADVVTATEYSIAAALEKKIGKAVYELAHPANIPGIRKRYTERIQNGYVLLGSSDESTHSELKKMAEEKNIEEFEISNNCSSNELIELLLSSNGLINLSDKANYGREIIYAAALNRLVVGNIDSDSARRCFPNTILNGQKDKAAYAFYWMTEKDNEYAEVFRQEAMTRVEFYNYGNMQKRFLNILEDCFGFNECFCYQNQTMKHRTESNIFENIHWVHGPKDVHYSKEEFSVVCLLKNAEKNIKSFMNHYMKLGARHFFFIDNNSTDCTKEKLMAYPNVTVYHTNLEHKKYESEIRKVIIEHHCRNKWCLYADDDELFDFPYSDMMTMSQFLQYLNLHGYTSVLGYMVDMFADTSRNIKDITIEDLVQTYSYCDISDIEKEKYFGPFQCFCNYNKMPDMEFENYFGGIREKIFNFSTTRLLLTKHSLIYVDRNVDALTHPHFSNKVKVADVNSIVKHYKFTSNLGAKVAERLHDKSFSYFSEQQYKAYHEVLKTGQKIPLMGLGTFKLTKVSELVERGFLQASQEYISFVDDCISASEAKHEDQKAGTYS